MCSVILGMITYNSYIKMKEVIGLEAVLESTLQVPYKSLILVDDSEDETAIFIRKWAEEHGKEILVSRSRLYSYHRPTRATARQTTIDIFFENFDGKWLMFVDDDVILKDGWWRWVEENGVLENPQVGEIWGINWDSTPERERFLKLFGVGMEETLRMYRPKVIAEVWGGPSRIKEFTGKLGYGMRRISPDYCILEPSKIPDY